MSPSAVTRQSSLIAHEQLLSRRVFLVLSLCLVMLLFAVYSPSLGFQFILDDHRYTADPRIQDAGHVWGTSRVLSGRNSRGGRIAFIGQVFCYG
jgi:hypothetical protein